MTTDSRHGHPVAPNLLGQRFEATRPDEPWLADITYVPTGEGWLYVAAIKDMATREHARRALFRWIETYDNRQRRRSALGYMTPAQAFEQMTRAA